MGDGLLAAEGRVGGAPAGMDFTEGDREGVSGLLAVSMGFGAGRLGGWPGDTTSDGAADGNAARVGGVGWAVAAGVASLA
jgi:hypothetical protein